TASLYQLSDGRMVVRLQNLDALNGPDLHVLLSAYPRPATKEELKQVPQYEIDLGPLKGNQGNQNYIIENPAFNVENYSEGSVVLYSTRYELVFSFAPLSAPQ
ncbi:MAG: DM13 domain-containing protein, partial [Chloroflexota bacterium]